VKLLLLAVVATGLHLPHDNPTVARPPAYAFNPTQYIRDCQALVADYQKTVELERLLNQPVGGP